MKRYRRALGIAALLALPTVLAALLAVWFEGVASAPRSLSPGAARSPVSARTRAARPPAAAAAAAAAGSGDPAPVRQARHVVMDEYEDALENRRFQRLESRFSAGQPAPEWSAEIDAYLRSELPRNAPGGVIRAVDCRSTLCRASVQYDDLASMNSAFLLAPPPQYELRSSGEREGKGGIVTYYFAPAGVRMKSITETTVK
jgi:hypothetical protein